MADPRLIKVVFQNDSTPPINASFLNNLQDEVIFQQTVDESLEQGINNLNNQIQDIAGNVLNAITLLDIDALLSYTGDGFVIVKDVNRGGNFISKTVIEIDPNTGSLYEVNNGTVFVKSGGGFWVRQYQNSIVALWFNVVGDGVVDDTVSIKNAIAYAIKTKSKILFDEGDFLITDQILINEILTDSSKNLISIHGAGSAKTRFIFKNVNQAAFKIEGNYVSGKYWQGNIEGIALIGDNSKKGLEIISFPYGVLKDVKIQGFNEDGYSINQSNSLRWYDSTIELNGYNGGIIFDQSNAAIRQYNVAYNSNGLNGLVTGLNTSYVPTITTSIALNNCEFSNNGTNDTVPKTGYLSKTADLQMFGARDCLVLDPYMEWYPKPLKDSYGTSNSGYVHYNAIRISNSNTYDSISNVIVNPHLPAKVRGSYTESQAYIDGARGINLESSNYNTVVGGTTGLGAKATSSSNYFYGTYGDLTDVALSDNELNIFANPNKDYLFNYLSSKLPQNLVMNGKADAYSGTKLIGWTTKASTTLGFTDGVSIATTANYGGIEQLISELDIGTYRISFDYLTSSAENIYVAVGSNTVNKSTLFTPINDSLWHTHTFTFTINSLSEIDNIKKLNFFGMSVAHPYSSSYSVKNIRLTKGTLSYPFFPSYKDASLDLNKGYIKSPDGSYWNLTITNAGVITPVKVV